MTKAPVEVAATVVAGAVHEGHPQVKCTTTVGVQSTVTVSEGYGFWVGSPGWQVLVGFGQTYRRCFIFLQTPKRTGAVIVAVSAAMDVHDGDEAVDEGNTARVGTSAVIPVGREAATRLGKGKSDDVSDGSPLAVQVCAGRL